MFFSINTFLHSLLSSILFNSYLFHNLSLGDSMVKNSPANTGDGRDVGLPSLGQEDSPGGAHGNPLQYSCLENPLGQRSLVGYSP